MNREPPLGRGAVTVFEALEDAGLDTAAVNFTCYRGRTRHRPTLPGVARPAYGPTRFFYYSLFESDVTGAPLAVLDRSAGSIDAYAAAVGRWLVTRDGFDFLVYYLPTTTSPRTPTAPRARRRRSPAATRRSARWSRRRAGRDEFLERYAVMLCSDHGQTRVERQRRALGDAASRAVRRRDSSSPPRTAPAMVYRLPGAPDDAAELAAAARRRSTAAEVVLFREGDEAVARRDGEELRFGPTATAGRAATTGSSTDPDGLERAWAALANPNAGEVLVSAAARASSSPTSAAATTSAAAATARSSQATRRCRCSRSGSTRAPARIVDVAPLVARPLRRRGRRATRACRLTCRRGAARDGRARSCAARDITDERVLAAMERVPRELFVPARARARAYDDAALPIGAGQTISQPYMVARICEALALHGGERVLDVGHGLRLPGGGARRARGRGRDDRADPGARRAGAGEPRRRGLRRRSRSSSATGRAALPEPGAVRRDRGRRRGARASRETLYEQLASRGRLVVPVGGHRASGSS